MRRSFQRGREDSRWVAGEVAGASGTSQFGYPLRSPRMTPNAPSSRGRMGRSRLDGVATALAPTQGSAPRQLALGISSPVLAPVREVLLPGAVKIAGWLSHDVQRSLATGFRQWALPPAGLRHPRVPSGHLMSVQSVCLGWHWEPYAYSKTADDTDGAPVKPLPVELRSGDLLVFGGPSRRIYHGVPKVLEGTAPSSLDLPPGRVSITLRETGL